MALNLLYANPRRFGFTANLLAFLAKGITYMLRLFRHYVPRSLMWLGAGEILVLMSSCYIALSIVLENQNGNQAHSETLSSLMMYTFIFVGVMVFSLFASGLYQLRLADNLRSTMLRLIVSILIGGLLTVVLFALTPTNWIAPNVIVVCFATTLTGLVGTRLVFYSVCDASTLRRQVLVIGTGNRAAQLAKDFNHGLIRGIDICGFVPVGDHNNQRINKNDIIIPEGEILSLVARLKIDEIVIALDDRRGNLPAEQILECKMCGTPVTELLDFFERHTGAISLESLKPSSMIFSDGFSRAAMGNWRKRTFDLLASTLLLIFALPIMLFTAAAIWLESWGRDPVFYRQTRVGKHGQPFQILKFRSMHRCAESNGAQWAAANDSRVTFVGQFIRQTRIDELPQLLNVFRGEMSFVGPRPEHPEFVENLKESIPFYDIRHKTLPGITGWAQVCYPYGASIDDARRKLQYDLYYMKNRSLFLDLTILFQTTHVCLWCQGAR